MATFLEIIFTAIAGSILLANFRVTLFESMQALQERSISMRDFQRLNAFTLLGAILLLLPGFFTDIIGVLLQFSFFATLFAKKFLHVRQEPDIYNSNQRQIDDDIIDVEIIDESNAQKKN